MTIYISLLRGINVGGHKQISMVALKALYQTIGTGHVKCLMQSGNVVFESTEKQRTQLALRIENSIEKGFGFQAQVFLRTAAELKEAVERNPFAGRSGINPSWLLVMFLSVEPDEDAKEKLLAINAGVELIQISGREVYLYYPNGIARSKLSNALIERTLGTSGTARNWNTLKRLVDYAESIRAAS
jgi:uncharacterized protein (DUF1697 family)